MKDLVEYILKNITTYPDDIVVTEEKEENSVTIKIKANEEDIPRIIGKEGKIIRSIRNIAKIVARKNDLWVNVQTDFPVFQ
jgi:uncharacterized protein